MLVAQPHRETALSDTDPQVLISEADIQARVNELAAQISEEYRDLGGVVLVGDESYQPREQTPVPVENSLRAARRMLTPTALAD